MSFVNTAKEKLSLEKFKEISEQKNFTTSLLTEMELNPVDKLFVIFRESFLRHNQEVIFCGDDIKYC